MKRERDYIQKISTVIVKLAPEYGVEMAGVFGSLVHGDFRGDSDVDILVKFSVPVGFIRFMQLENELSDKLGRKVDLVTEGSLSPYFRDDVIKQLRIVYERK